MFTMFTSTKKEGYVKGKSDIGFFLTKNLNVQKVVKIHQLTVKKTCQSVEN